MWETKTVRAFGKRKYRLDHWFKGRTEANLHAEAKRRRNFLARIVPAPAGSIWKWLVYVSFK